MQGQSPSDKYSAQASKFASPEAAEKNKASPDINKEGGSMGVAAFQVQTDSHHFQLQPSKSWRSLSKHHGLKSWDHGDITI